MRVWENMLRIIGVKYVVMSEQEWREVRWRELNTTFGNNERNLREISKHQELSCGTRNRYICEMINFPMFYYFTRRSITNHTSWSWRQFLPYCKRPQSLALTALTWNKLANLTSANDWKSDKINFHIISLDCWIPWLPCKMLVMMMKLIPDLSQSCLTFLKRPLTN